MTKLNTLLSIAALTAVISAVAVMPASAEDATKEKCYGVAKAGKNDCASGDKVSCAGSAKMDSEGAAFIAVPKGLCERLVGGSLVAK